MLKIDFFPREVIADYENTIAPKVKMENGGKDEIEFVPSFGYTISIKTLLSSERDDILAVNGMKLYMLICSSHKLRSDSSDRLLNALKSEGYELDESVSSDDLPAKAAELLKNRFAKFNANFANTYFPKIFTSILELNDALDKMFNEVNNPLKSLIYYDMISSELRHKLMSSLKIRTCPYCNRNYITVYGKENEERSTADLDHFFQKSQYPLFALSLFNFIPSCQICNSRMKNTRSAENTLYPFKEGFENDAHFELKYTGAKCFGADILHFWQAIKDVEHSDFKLEIVIDPSADSEKKQRIENSKELFRLEQVYENHKSDALEAALRTRIYCEGSYKRFCEKLFDKCRDSGMKNTSVYDLESSILNEGIDDEWLMFGIFMNDENRRYDKPLSRMIYDIYSGK